ncbi:protein phosphatase inhibitor 2-like [Paramacrobiotus metropolitanus]|uniref:protein phosphatase inhibitor 2-like n=1 Tax=Paramacrobiotus metropolitanus TaxID=2943436 RepID=UPI002445E1D1|nr:protein phosphatase inhibitor 2-like [Paramacrobiotus metropolitanus]XP_055342821.1 protein phosphatase inhibitor 2-like [Paramacrobiotus metropolitanus]
MADHMHHKPVKGILKKTDSIDPGEQPRRNSASQEHKEMKWDEMNILATHHPPGKDYGHMKIEEPKTPFSHSPLPPDHDVDDDGDTEMHEPRSESEPDLAGPCGINAASLTERLNAEQMGHQCAKMIRVPSHNDEDEEIPDSELTPEEREKRRQFKEHRKEHYNEFQMMKKAKELLHDEGIETMEDNPPPNAKTSST